MDHRHGKEGGAEVAEDSAVSVAVTISAGVASEIDELLIGSVNSVALFGEKEEMEGEKEDGKAVCVREKMINDRFSFPFGVTSASEAKTWKVKLWRNSRKHLSINQSINALTRELNNSINQANKQSIT